MDVHDSKTRSFNMSRIRSTDTKPELVVRKLCHQMGFRYRLNRRIHDTKPDLTFVRKKAAIFVHGCFWHSHTCKYGKVKPKTNASFWQQKRSKTQERDQQNFASLKDNGWSVLVIWECECKEIGRLKNKIVEHFNYNQQGQ